MDRHWPLLSFLGSVVGFYLLLIRNPDFKFVAEYKQEWFVIAVLYGALNFIPFMLICNFVLGNEFRDKCKDSRLLNAFLNFIFLVVPAVIEHLADYPEFHIKVKDVTQHNSQKMFELFTACSFAISSWGLSKTYDLTFESGLFSICLEHAMKFSLEIVNETGKHRNLVFIFGTFGFCLVVIVLRQYLEKNQVRDTTSQRNDESPDSTNTNYHNQNNRTDESTFPASNTNYFESSDSGPRFYIDTSSNHSRDNEDGVEQEVPFEPKFELKEGKDGVKEDEGTSASDDYAGKIKDSEVATQKIEHEEGNMRSSTSSKDQSQDSGSRGYEVDDNPLLPKNGDDFSSRAECKARVGLRRRNKCPVKEGQDIANIDGLRVVPYTPKSHVQVHTYSNDNGSNGDAFNSTAGCKVGRNKCPAEEGKDITNSEQSDEDGMEDSGKHHFSPSSIYLHMDPDMDSGKHHCSPSSTRLHMDSSSASARNETCRSSPFESPRRVNFTSNRAGLPVLQGDEGSPSSQHDGLYGQQTMAVLRKPEQGTEDAYSTDYFSDDLSIFPNQSENSQKPLDFENNDLIWFPPPPDDENDDAEGNFLACDDVDDDSGNSSAFFSSSSCLSYMFPSKEKHNEGNKEPLKAVIQGRFRALVSRQLRGKGIQVGKQNGSEDWLDIVATVAWQAANFVRPDTSKGGSMDPGNYVKIKCIAAGNPSESTIIKGVVCTKTLNHKRMTSQYKRPRLLLLGGALEYQKVPNQLVSSDTLLQQENEHLRMIISKIETLRPNVLLVEESVASLAQEYLLAKEIPLVSNVKRPILERIARCTGALITPSVDSLSTARLGHCELFQVKKVVEHHETADQFNIKPSKALMFFEGCPTHLGCTVLLKGACRDQLKKIKHVVQCAVFTAYHLALEPSFLADEGATLLKYGSLGFGSFENSPMYVG